MSQVVVCPEVVEKEFIPNLKFTTRKNVNKYPSLILRKIAKATQLGNLFRNKVKIFFEDDESLKLVETTVWAFGDKHIVLKGGIMVPIHRIVEIKLL